MSGSPPVLGSEQESQPPTEGQDAVEPGGGAKGRERPSPGAQLEARRRIAAALEPPAARVMRNRELLRSSAMNAAPFAWPPQIAPDRLAVAAEAARSMVLKMVEATEAVSLWFEQHSDSIKLAGRWIAAHESEIRALIEVFPAWEHAARKAARAGYGPLLEELPFGIAVRVAIELEEAGEPAALNIVDPLLRNDEAVEAIASTLRPIATSPPARQITTGLGLFLKGDDVSALPGLLIGFEGLLAQEATARGLVERHGSKLYVIADDDQRTTKKVGTADALIGLLGIADEDLVTMLRRRVFGTAGNPYRHGTAEDGHRERALMLVAALVALIPSLAPASTKLRLADA